MGMQRDIILKELLETWERYQEDVESQKPMGGRISQQNSHQICQVLQRAWKWGGQRDFVAHAVTSKKAISGMTESRR